MKKTIAAILIALLALTANLKAETVGPGPSILDMDGANNAVDTGTDGTTDQSRQNLDESFTATLAAGEYAGTTWSYRAGQVGSVIPYIAVSTGADTYEIVAVGSQVDVGADGLDMDVTVPFGGSSFMLSAETEIFGGIVNPTVAGSQNPIYTNLASGSTVDHDNNADGMLSPAVVGGTVDGFGHANLARSYAFSIDVNAVPEPSSFAMVTILAGLMVMGVRRRR